MWYVFELMSVLIRVPGRLIVAHTRSQLRPLPDRPQITPIFHFPLTGNQFDSTELPNIVRNVSLLGGLIVVRATSRWRPQYF